MTPEHQPVAAAWPCSICGGATVYQAFSGGREWYCAACDTTGEYPDDAPGLPRAALLRTPEGVIALRAQMDQDLARRRDQGDGSGPADPAWVVGCGRAGHPVNHTHQHPYISPPCAGGDHAVCAAAGQRMDAPGFCECECHRA